MKSIKHLTIRSLLIAILAFGTMPSYAQLGGFIKSAVDKTKSEVDKSKAKDSKSKNESDKTKGKENQQQQQPTDQKQNPKTNKYTPTNYTSDPNIDSKVIEQGFTKTIGEINTFYSTLSTRFYRQPYWKVESNPFFIFDDSSRERIDYLYEWINTLMTRGNLYITPMPDIAEGENQNTALTEWIQSAYYAQALADRTSIGGNKAFLRAEAITLAEKNGLNIRYLAYSYKKESENREAYANALYANVDRTRRWVRESAKFTEGNTTNNEILLEIGEEFVKQLQEIEPRIANFEKVRAILSNAEIQSGKLYLNDTQKDVYRFCMLFREFDILMQKRIKDKNSPRYKAIELAYNKFNDQYKLWMRVHEKFDTDPSLAIQMPETFPEFEGLTFARIKELINNVYPNHDVFKAVILDKTYHMVMHDDYYKWKIVSYAARKFNVGGIQKIGDNYYLHEYQISQNSNYEGDKFPGGFWLKKIEYYVTDNDKPKLLKNYKP